MLSSKTGALAERGFTIVEIMVGLVLGMIGIIIMYQVFAVFEGQRRTTVSGGNAQTAGHISMHGIERDVRLAGLGLVYVSRPDFFEYSGEVTCPGGVRTYSASAGGLGWADGARPTVPVRVTEGGATPDSFTILYGPSAIGGAPGKLASVVNTASLSGGFLVNNAPWINDTAVPPVNGMFKKGDIIMIGQPSTPGQPCVRLKISEVQKDAGTGLLLLKVAPGVGFDENPPTSEYTGFLPAAGYSLLPESIVTHMGGSLARIVYTVDPATMQLQANGTPIAEGVVSLQVQYGIGPLPGTVAGCSLKAVEPACQSVASWQDAVASGGVNWAALDNPTTDPVHVKRIKAIRISIVTRSQNIERPADNLSLYGAGREIAPKAGCLAAGDYVEAPAPRICGWADPAGGTAVPLVDPSIAPDEVACAAQLGAPCWNRYRYKVYETMVPLRNVLWGTKNS